MADMEYYHSEKSENMPSSFEAILTLLEFPISPELEEARQMMLELLQNPATDPETLQAAWTVFTDTIERIVENPELDMPAHIKLQIGALIYKALIFKDIGDYLRYAQELDDAESYAFNAKISEISMLLSTELEAVVETLPHDAPEIIVLKLKSFVTDEDRLTLLDSINDGDDFNDVLGTAYGMLLENDFDPDHILKGVGLIQ